MPIQSKYGHFTTTVTTQTGSYAVQTRDFGSIVQANGATTFTLPAPGPGLNGAWVQFYSIAAGDMVVTAGTGNIVAFNNAAADTVTFGTNTQEIGSSIEMICDGTSWLAFIDLNQSDQAVTVA